MNRGNAPKVTAEAAEIARRYRETEVSLAVLCLQYRCAYKTMVRAMLTQMSCREYRRLAHKRLGPGGKATWFPKGMVPWNKGKKGWCPPGCEATQFQPGDIRGAAARHYRPVGAITIRHDHAPRRTRGRPNRRPGPPRRYIKVKDDGRPQDRWAEYARYVYEREHGPIPKGMCVVHDDGDTLNDEPSNLVLDSRAGSFRRLGTIRPKAMELRRKHSALAAKRRHAQNRAAKRWAKRQRRRARHVWACLGCEAELPRKAERCPKCGSFSIERRRLEPMPESMKSESIINEVKEHAGV